MHVNGWWTTADGEDMLISEMTNSHLSNTIAWLERHMDIFEDNAEAVMSLWMSVSAEMATYHAEHLVDKYRSMHEFALFSLEMMREEKQVRGQRGWNNTWNNIPI